MTAADLNRATKNKNDELYTPIEAIEREIPNYSEFLRGKHILCNCRDADSAFARYDFFKHGVREVVVVGADKIIVGAPYGQTSYEVPYPKTLIPASYKDEMGLQLLSECDIVITNPPFSKIRDFIKTVHEAGKDFIIVAPIHAVANKYVGRLLVDGKLRIGYTSISHPFTHEDGSKQKFGNIVWFTNLPVKRKQYTPSGKHTVLSRSYPCYDNLPDVIFVDRARNIPLDYKGVMAVPLSFLCHHNEEQFELVDFSTLKDSEYAILSGFEATVDGKNKFSRVLIRRKQ